MHCGDDHENYYRENEGCWYVLQYKLREKRRIIVISLLLIAAVASIITGLSLGITLKEYSNVAVTVGIWFPGIIIVIICIYIVINCVRDSFFPNANNSPQRNSYLQDESRNCEEVTQQPQRNRQSRTNLSVYYQPKVHRKSKNGSQRAGGLNSDRIFIAAAESSPNYLGAKMNRKKFKSLSNSDIARYQYSNKKVLPRGSEVSVRSDGEDGTDRYPTKYKSHQDVPKSKELKRCTSEISRNNKNKISREKMLNSNFESRDIPRRYMQEQSSEAGEEETEVENCGGAIGPRMTEISNPMEYSYKCHTVSGNNEAETVYNAYMNENRRMHSVKKIYENRYSPEIAERENMKYPATKHEIPRFNSSSAVEYPRGYRQPLLFPSSATNRGKYFTGNRSAMDTFSCGNEQNGQFFRSNSKIPSSLQNTEERQKYVLPQQEAEIFGRVKRKAIYYSSPRSRESTPQLPKHVFEDGRYLKKSSELTHMRSSSFIDKQNVDNLTDHQQAPRNPLIHNTQSMRHLARSNEFKQQEMTPIVMDDPLERKQMVGRQMSTHSRREYLTKETQTCEPFELDCREKNQLPYTTQREIPLKDMHTSKTFALDYRENTDNPLSNITQRESPLKDMHTSKTPAFDCRENTDNQLSNITQRENSSKTIQEFESSTTDHTKNI